MVTTVRQKLVEFSNFLSLFSFQFELDLLINILLSYLVVGYDLPPVVFLLTETLLRHRRQFLLLPQLVSQSIKGSYVWCLGLKLDHLGCPATRVLLGAVVGLRVELSQNVIDLAARSLDWI